jgi:hypothetical protein
MNDWQSTYPTRVALPRDLSGFEIEAFFTYSELERRVIDDERRAPPRTGVQRRTRLHASPSDFGELGEIRFGLLRHDEHGDQPGVCRPQRPTSIDALRRHLFAYARSKRTW